MPFTSHFRAAFPAVLLAVASTACDDAGGASEDDDPACEDGKCDGLGALGGELATFNDPIAVFLRDTIDAKGRISVSYLDMLKAISAQQGCSEDNIDSYVISDDLVAQTAAFPRVVNTLCSNDRTKADLAFFALSFGDASGTDLDTRKIEMFAWDPVAFQYRFYKGTAAKGTKTKVAITLDPSECKECHLQPEHIEGVPMPMTPIMNELAAPWQHWFAEPQSFDHVVDEVTQKAPNFAMLAGPGSKFRKSAARLEQTIRSAFSQRIATARLRLRRDPAAVDQAMGLLRPLFCDEQLTYVTEDGKSGLISANVVVDEGLASVFFQIMGTGWPWEWWQDKVMRYGQGSSQPVTMMPTRGAATIAYEKQLLAVRALTADQVMRVRALDWGTPTMSSFRCELWHNALPRVKSAPPAGARNVDLLAPLLDEILTVRKGDFGISGTDLPAQIPLVSPKSGTFISLVSADEASVQNLAEQLVSGMIGEAECQKDGTGACLTDATGLGGMIETRFKAAEGAGRDQLLPLRKSRACEAKTKYPNAPAIADLGGC